MGLSGTVFELTTIQISERRNKLFYWDRQDELSYRSLRTGDPGIEFPGGGDRYRRGATNLTVLSALDEAQIKFDLIAATGRPGKALNQPIQIIRSAGIDLEICFTDSGCRPEVFLVQLAKERHPQIVLVDDQVLARTLGEEFETWLLDKDYNQSESGRISYKRVQDIKLGGELDLWYETRWQGPLLNVLKSLGPQAKSRIMAKIPPHLRPHELR